MDFSPPFNRRSIRLKDYDYSTPGAYFITVCTIYKQSLLGKILKDRMCPNDIGEAVAECWKTLSIRFPLVEVDNFVVMPSHVHGIISIIDTNQHNFNQECDSLPLGKIIAYFKYISTKKINIQRKTPGHRIWQRNYYEHVIRDEEEMSRAREYIETNPLRWALDKYNPNCAI